MMVDKIKPQKFKIVNLSMFRKIKEDTNMLLGEFQENANKKLKEMKAMTSYMREEFNRDRNTKE